MQYGFNYDKDDNNVKTNFLYDLSQAPHSNEAKPKHKSKKPSKHQELKSKQLTKPTTANPARTDDNDDFRNDTLPAPYFTAYLNSKNNHQSFIDLGAKKKDEKLKESNSHQQAKSRLDGIFSWMSKTPTSSDHQSKLDQIENPAFIICDEKYSKQLEKVQQEARNQKRSQLQTAASEYRPQSEFGRSSGFPSPPVCKSSMMENFRYYSDNMSFKSDTLSDTIVFKSPSQMPTSNLQNPSFLFDDENYDNQGYKVRDRNDTKKNRSKLKTRIPGTNNKY